MRQITANKVPLLNAIQETQSAVGAVAHVYAPYAIARSLLPDLNVDDILPPYARAFRNHATLQGRTAFLLYAPSSCHGRARLRASGRAQRRYTGQSKTGPLQARTWRRLPTQRGVGGDRAPCVAHVRLANKCPFDGTDHRRRLFMQNRLEGLIASQGGKNGNGETRLTRALDDGQRYGLLPRSRRP